MANPFNLYKLQLNPFSWQIILNSSILYNFTHYIKSPTKLQTVLDQNLIISLLQTTTTHKIELIYKLYVFFSIFIELYVTKLFADA